MANGESVHFSTSHSAQIVAILAIQPNRALSRDKVASELWPEVSLSVAKRNLRTALVFVRRSLGADSVESSESSLILKLPITSDLQDLEELTLVSTLSQDSAERISALRGQSSLLGKSVLEGWDAPWVIQFRQGLSERLTETNLALAKAYEDSDMLPSAIEFALRVLSTSPSGTKGEEALGILMRSLAHQGKKGEAVRRYKEYLERLKSEGKPPPSASISQLYKEVESGKTSKGGYLDTTERGLVADLYDNVLKTNPDLAIEMLAVQTGKWREMAESESALHLLERSLVVTTGWSPARLSVVKDLIAIAESLGRFDLFDYWADQIIQSSEIDLKDRAGALSYKGFCQFERRNYVKAEELMSKAVTMAEASGDTVSFGIVRSNLAGLFWHQGDLDRSRQMYVEMFDMAIDETPARKHFLHSVLLVNLIYVETMDSQWAKANEYRKRLMEIIEITNNHIVFACSQSVIGYTDLRLGRVRDGLSEIVTGIRLTQQQGRRRFLEISLDYAIAALANAGKREEARSLAIACIQHRGRHLHFHSTAERRVVEDFAGIRMDDLPKDGPLNSLSTARLAAWACLQVKELAQAL